MAVLFMARRVITGALTYSTASSRSSALTRINNALGPYAPSDFVSDIGTGITTSGTTINISCVIDDRDTAFDAAKAIYDAAVQTTRFASGWLSVNRI
jgi:hypothetical protein